MKLTVLLLFLGLAVNSYAQNQGSSGGSSSVAPNNSAPVEVSPYAVTARGPHNRIWQRVTAKTNSLGQAFYHTNAYSELATGLCYWNGNQWVDSSDQIQLTQNGASATGTQHQVSFAPNINSAGAINLTTPDSQQMTSQVLGLAYLDGDTGSNVLFAGIQDSIGQLLPSGNQVIYTNAFANAEADLLYSQKLSGLEQDVVIRQQLPSASSYGLNGSNIWLQIWTEFTAAPIPQITQPEGGGDSFLDFGAMKMGSGKAFMLGNSSSAVPVVKEWVNTQGRTLLIESVLLSSVASQIAALPALSQASTGSNSATASIGSQAKIHRNHPSYALLSPPNPNLKNLNLPAPKRAKKSPATMRMASAGATPKGFVLDYNIVNGNQTNIIFQGDSTYYITNSVNLYGSCILEGGTVIKYSTNTSASITVTFFTNLVCKTAFYHPAIFTAQDDNSVGDPISGSTGTPTNYYGGPAIQTPSSHSGFTPAWSHLRFSWLQQGLHFENSSSPTIYDAQFVNCQVGIYLDTVYLHLRNALFSNVATNFYCVPEPAELFLENVTVDGGNCLCDIEGYESYPWDDPPIGDLPSFKMCLTNSIIIVGTTNLGVGLNISGNPNVSVTDTTILTNDSNVFQTVGGGSFYLPSGSTNRGAGTTNIDPTLLADLSQLTTWAPVVYAANTLSNDIVLTPVVARYTNGNPDRGYYYPAIDYAFANVLYINGTLTVTNGTVIAAFDTNASGYALCVSTDGLLISQGAPNNLNRFVNFNLVQECSTTNWYTPYNALINPGYWVSVAFRFTDFAIPSLDTAYFTTFTGFPTPFGFQDCQFHGGIFFAAPAVIDFTNCLLERVNTQMFGDGSTPLTLRNNLFYGGILYFKNFPTNSVVQDNMFDQTGMYDDGSYIGGWNGYVTNFNQLSVSFTNDVVLANSVYETNLLGNYYLPTNSLLITNGSTTANLIGLYEYTTQTNQVMEADAIVDIGYHYVAVGANGQPIDSNGGGIPNYLEDTNGSGIVGGSTNWMYMLTDPNNIGPTGLQVYTPLK